MSEALTPIERRIYHYLVDYLKAETYQPSVREIGRRFGIRSTKTVTEHLQALERKGYLDRTPSRSRALKILGLDLSPRTYTIPLYQNSEAAADEDDPEVEGRFELDRSLACSPDCFLVRAHGDATPGHGVLEGDLVLVEPCDQLAASDVGVYEVEGAIKLRDAAHMPEGAGATGWAERGGNGGELARLLGAARALFRNFPKS